MLTNQQQGMTLVELVISMALVGGMMALAVPAVGDWSDANRVKATGDSMLNGLQLAKMEAVRQNTRARFVLTDTPTFTTALGGQAGDWEVCTADNAGSFLNNQGQVWFGTEVGTPARVGISTAALATQNYATPLAAGTGLTGFVPPAGTQCAGTTAADTNVNVTFDAMGRMATTNLIAPSITRIDILNARPNNANKRLVIIINPQGQIKLCNPASQDPNQRCG